MLEHIPENTTARWEIRRPNGETAQHYRTGLASSAGGRQLLKNLSTFGSHILPKLGKTLTLTGERSSGGEPSGRTTAA